MGSNMKNIFIDYKKLNLSNLANSLDNNSKRVLDLLDLVNSYKNKAFDLSYFNKISIEWSESVNDLERINKEKGNIHNSVFEIRSIQCSYSIILCSSEITLLSLYLSHPNFLIASNVYDNKIELIPFQDIQKLFEFRLQEELLRNQSVSTNIPYIPPEQRPGAVEYVINITNTTLDQLPWLQEEQKVQNQKIQEIKDKYLK
jgi:hypothetical protein